MEQKNECLCQFRLQEKDKEQRQAVIPSTSDSRSATLAPSASTCRACQLLYFLDAGESVITSGDGAWFKAMQTYRPAGVGGVPGSAAAGVCGCETSVAMAGEVAAAQEPLQQTSGDNKQSRGEHSTRRQRARCHRATPSLDPSSPQEGKVQCQTVHRKRPPARVLHNALRGSKERIYRPATQIKQLVQVLDVDLKPPSQIGAGKQRQREATQA